MFDKILTAIDNSSRPDMGVEAALARQRDIHGSLITKGNIGDKKTVMRE